MPAIQLNVSGGFLAYMGFRDHKVTVQFTGKCSLCNKRSTNVILFEGFSAAYDKPAGRYKLSCHKHLHTVQQELRKLPFHLTKCMDLPENGIVTYNPRFWED